VKPAAGAGALSSGTALLQLLYLATPRIIEKWKMPVQNWAATLQQLTIIFGDRVRNYTNI